jgi:hypothetical protein
MNRLALEKLKVAQLFTEFSDVYETCSQMPTAGLYPEPDESSPHPHPLLL